MATMKAVQETKTIPLFGARKMARALLAEVDLLNEECANLKDQVTRLGILSIVELEAKRDALQAQINEQAAKLSRERYDAEELMREMSRQLEEVRRKIVITEDLALLQEAGIYKYRHPLTDAVAYQTALAKIEDQIKAMVRKDGGAVLAATNWTVNGSITQGRAMVRDFSKLLLRAFNAEADNLVRGLKPYKLDAAIQRLSKVGEVIQQLGKSMEIRISTAYFNLRIKELELTADFLQKQAEEKMLERAERERLREERKVQQEIEMERARLLKERQHYSNALSTLIASQVYDEASAARLRAQLNDVERAIQDVDYRAANIRAGYVYVISNFGSFGEEIVKIGMTRRLDPMDRIRELSDASVPFNFDIHALFFSKDAVGIEMEMHRRLSTRRVNLVNQRREFFRVTPLEVKMHLVELAGELLQFQDVPDALEYRDSIKIFQLGELDPLS
jgi:hypothetical protein